VGARLGESEHRADNLKLFSFALDEEDTALLTKAFGGTRRIAAIVEMNTVGHLF